MNDNEYGRERHGFYGFWGRGHGLRAVFQLAVSGIVLSMFAACPASRPSGIEDSGVSRDVGENDAGGTDSGVDAGTGLHWGDGGGRDGGKAWDGGTNDSGPSVMYGVPWGAEGLTNTDIGFSHYDAPKPGRVVSVRFRARSTGVFESWKQFFIFVGFEERPGCNQPPFSPSHPNACYGANSGGIIRMELMGDDGSPSHTPDGRVLASAIIVDPRNTSPAPPIWRGFREVPEMMWTAHPRLEVEHLYHMVFTNTYSGTSPWWNYDYVSIDSLLTRTARDRQPGASDTDFAVLYRDPGSDWREVGATPSFQVNLVGGTSQGLGYIDTRASKPVGGSMRARQTFRISGPSRRLENVYARTRKGAFEPDAGLWLRVEDGSGRQLDECEVPSTLARPEMSWVHCELEKRPLVSAGETYRLLMYSGAGANAYWLTPLQKGNAYGFKSSTYFSDGHAEYSEDDGLTWPSSIAGWGDAEKFDLSFYFLVH